MAAGDIIAARINPDGRLLHLKLEGMAAGGTYLFGTSTPAVFEDRTNATAKVKLNVTSSGYSTAGVLGTIARTVWGPIDQRLPYGDGTVGKWISSGAMTGIMVHGETVTQATTGATATVITNCPCAPLIVNTVTGSPNSTDVWTGGTSGAVFTPTVAPATYSGVTVKREGVEGSDLWIAIALDEYIYSDCTVTLDALSAIYTKTAVPNNAATGYAVTNDSEAAHAKSVVRWASVPYERITAPTFTVKAAAYHRLARDGKPLACMIFTAYDGTTTRTVTATAMTLERMPATGLYTCFYEATFTSADFADNTTLTVNCVAYPWVGDAASLTTSVGGTEANLDLSPLSLFIDWDDDYGVTIAYVDQTSSISTASATTALIADETLTQATTGATAVFNFAIDGSPNKVYVTNVTGSPNNSNIWTGGTSGATITPTTTPTAVGSDSNVAYDISNDATAKLNPMATIGAASVAIQTYNNANRGRNTADAGIIYLRRGNHAVTGAVTAVAATTWLTITREVGLADGQARLKKKTGTLPVRLTARLQRLYDLDVIVPTGASDPGTTWYGANVAPLCKLWADYCRITSTGYADGTNAVFPVFTPAWFTHNTLTRQQNLQTATSILPRALLSLGNSSSDGINFLSEVAVIGCSWYEAGNVISDNTYDNCYYASNKYVKGSNKFIDRSSTCSHGIAIICNELERTSTSGPVLLIVADAVTAHSANVNLIHNTLAGERVNWSYCNGATPANRINHSAKYNAMQWMAHKYDSNTSQKNVLANPVTYGAGHAGNYSEAIGTPSVDGLIWPGWLWGVNASAGYTNDLSLTTTAAGSGDYLPTEVSPLLSRVIAGESVWPYGINGVAIPNDGTGAAGAYQRSLVGVGSGSDISSLLLLGLF